MKRRNEDEQRVYRRKSFGQWLDPVWRASVQDDDHIHRRSKVQKLMVRRVLIVVCLVILAFSLWNLGSYTIDAIRNAADSRQMTRRYELAVLQTTETPQSTPTPEPVRTIAPAPTLAPQMTKAPAVHTAQTTDELMTQAVPAVYQAVVYPNNPEGEYSPVFKDLRKVNSDVMAWLSIENVLSQPVMYRDNVYYLDHGLDGKANVNGAVFLDEGTDLRSNRRPSCYLVYGHNMKTGAMFGTLKKYMEFSWYADHPLITFNTVFEDGMYAVFAAGTTCIEKNALSEYPYVNIYGLQNDLLSVRQDTIDGMIRCSSFTPRIEAKADDQLLVLITCNGNDAERVFVAARRLRDNENEQTINRMFH